MTYASGGLIQATDYNGFVGTSPSSTANQLNTVWAVGNGNAGYGQSALPQVSAAGTVTATQWASLINTLNSVYVHQTGSGTGLGAPTAGSLISYMSVLSGDINTAYSNRLAAASNGSTTTGSVFSATTTAAAGVGSNINLVERTVTFSSGDAARYFFNAGGYLNIVVTGCTNNDGTARSADLCTLWATNVGGVSGFRSATNGGRTGTGGTVTNNNTGIGYYTNTTAGTAYWTVSSTTSPYTADFAYIYCYTGTPNVSGNADNGNVIKFGWGYNSAAHSAFNGTLNVTLNHRIDIVYPESTNLSPSWGTVTIS